MSREYDIARFVRRACEEGVHRLGRDCARAAMLVGDVARASRGGSPRIILHAGGHKTGTTTLQAVIGPERRRLARQGVHVLRTGQASNGAHHRLILALEHGGLGRLERRVLGAELRHSASTAVLISSERASVAIGAGRGHGVIDGLRAAGAGMIRLLFYLRSPFALANAAYAERTSALTLGGASFAEFLATRDESSAYRYEHLLELGRREDVDLAVRPYSEAARRSIVADFADALGVDLAQAAEPRRNASLGPVALEAMRRIAAEMGDIGPRRRQRLRTRLAAIGYSLPEAPFWGIGPDEEALLPTADRRTEELAMAAWSRSWRDGIGEERRPLNLFDPPDPLQRALLEDCIERMRRAASLSVSQVSARPAASGLDAETSSA